MFVCLQPSLHGMVPVKAGKFEPLQRGAMHWPSSLKQCAAVCNSLNLVNRLQVVGDLADYTAFKACEARFVVCLTTWHWPKQSALLQCTAPPTFLASRVLCCAV